MYVRTQNSERSEKEKSPRLFGMCPQEDLDG